MKYFYLVFLLLFFLESMGQEVKLGLPIGHSHRITFVNFSPDGKFIVSASSDNTAKLWDVNSGKLLHSLEDHKGFLKSAQFSTSGQKLLSVSSDSTVKFWDVESGNLLHNFGKHPHVNCASFSPDGKIVSTVSNTKTMLWDVESGKKLQTIDGGVRKFTLANFNSNGQIIATTSMDHDKHNKDKENDNILSFWEVKSGRLLNSIGVHSLEINTINFSPSGKLIVTASRDSTAKIWDSRSGELFHTMKSHKGSVIFANFSSDGKILVTTSTDNTAKLWDVKSGELLHSLDGHTKSVTSAAFSPDGQFLLTTSYDNKMILWNVQKGKLIQNQRHDYNYLVTYANFSPDGQKVVAGSSFGNKGGGYRVFIWDLQSDSLLDYFERKTSFFRSANFSPNGLEIVTNDDRSINFWDIQNGGQVKRIFDYRVLKSKLSPDGQTIVTTELRNIIKFRNVQNGNVFQKFQLQSIQVSSDFIKANYVYDFAYSPNQHQISTATEDGIVRIWDIETGEILQKFEGHTSRVRSVSFSPDGKKIVTASEDRTVRVWDVQSGNLLNKLDEHTNHVNSANFSPDGQTLITASDDNSAILWDVNSGNLKQSVEGHIGGINYAEFSPDGRSIVTTSNDQTAKIWNAANSDLIFSLEGHKGSVYSASFNADGTLLLTRSADGSFIIWDTQTGKKLIQQFVFDNDPNKWVHFTEGGYFDASPEAMDMMYWTKGLEVIEFSQLKERCYVPGLWEIVMNGEQPKGSCIGDLKLQPELEIDEVEKDGDLPIKLKKREGGYGEVAIFINGKEVSKDIRGSQFDTTATDQTLYYNIQDHPYLVDGKNAITVKVSSANGVITSRGATVTYEYEKQDLPPVQFFGVVIGVGDYLNDAINLKYPEKDAEAIAMGIQLGATNLFGEERTHMYSLISNTQNKPTKQNIKTTFDSIAEIAKAEDIITVYLSGHGITWGDEGHSDFYFLTSTATSKFKEAYHDPVIRNRNTISTTELVEWLKSIPATKQVMIIDACGSGQAVDNLLASRDVDGSQIKAIDRMKDRTGMFIISGCAADALSYESSKYGQGLLTYSILQGLKGAALKEDQYVDVNTILNFAKDQVPKLASDIGGVQQPQLLIPKGGSFDIGILPIESRDLIPLSNAKKVFVRSQLSDLNKNWDVLKISQALNQEISLIASKGSESSLVFFDVSEYPEACMVAGAYEQDNNSLSIDMKLICGGKEIENHRLTAKDKKELVSKVVQIIGQ